MKFLLHRLRKKNFKKNLLYIDNFFYLLMAVPIKKSLLNSNLKYLIICFFSIIFDVIIPLLFIFFQLVNASDVLSYNKALKYVDLYTTKLFFLNKMNKEKIFSLYKHIIYFVNSSKMQIELDQYFSSKLVAKLVQSKNSVFHFDNFLKKISFKNNVCLN